MPISTATVSALKTSIGRKLPRKCLGDVWDVPATCLRRPSSAGNRLEEAHARAVSRRRASGGRGVGRKKRLPIPANAAATARAFLLSPATMDAVRQAGATFDETVRPRSTPQSPAICHSHKKCLRSVWEGVEGG